MDELDKGSADGTGLDGGPGIGTDDDAGLAEGVAELEEYQSEVEALRAEINEGATGQRRGREGKRMATRQEGRRPRSQATTQLGDRKSGSQAGTLPSRQGGREAGKQA